MFIYELQPNEVVVMRAAGFDDPEQQGLNYLAETERTASNVFNGDDVTVVELVDALRQFQYAGEALNRYKKIMFRKQSRGEAGLLSLSETELRNSPTISQFCGSAHDDLFHGVIGVSTEAGELAEFLADALEGKQRFDLTPVREEIGDVLWYLSRLVKWAETTFLTEMKRNIAKLRARHGESFNKERDMNRDLAREHSVLETHGTITDRLTPEDILAADDAPEWTDDQFAQAELKEGEL